MESCPLMQLQQEALWMKIQHGPCHRAALCRLLVPKEQGASHNRNILVVLSISGNRSLHVSAGLK